MSTHPYIPLYVDDFEAATAHLSVEEDGVYNRLLRLCWRTPGCSLPNDTAWIARKIRMTPAQFERIAASVLTEFFKLQRGRFVQRRLKAEYDDISRKKSARQNAGKKGGDAKARKDNDNPSSNASVLPADTGAFQTQNHTQNQEEDAGASSAPAPTAKAKAKPTKRKAETPIPDGFPDDAAKAEATDSADTAGKAINADREADRFRNHADQTDRRCRDWGAAWRNWIIDAVEKAPAKATPKGPAAQAPAPAFTGPADLRAAAVAKAGPDFAVGYLDRCIWLETPDRSLVAPNQFIADRITRDIRPVLREFGVSVVVQAGAAA